MTGEPVRKRRRGGQLEAEIREAVFAELAEAGYRGLTMQGVARRAGTGKAPLYRRWTDKQQMLIDVLAHQPPGRQEEQIDTGQLRTDLIQILAQMSSAMAEPVGRSLYALIVEMVLQRDRHPQAAEAVIESLLEPRLDAISAALRRAAPARRDPAGRRHQPACPDRARAGDPPATALRQPAQPSRDHRDRRPRPAARARRSRARVRPARVGLMSARQAIFGSSTSPDLAHDAYWLARLPGL